MQLLFPGKKCSFNPGSLYAPISWRKKRVRNNGWSRTAWIQVSPCSFLIRSIFLCTAPVLDLGLAESYLLYSDPSSFCCAASLRVDMWRRTTLAIRRWVMRQLQGIYTPGYTRPPSLQSLMMSACAEANKFWCPHPHHVSVQNSIYPQRRARVRKMNFLTMRIQL